MARRFQGRIKLDVRDSKPDWEAFLDTKAPKDAPNVLVILYDDTGQAAWSPYGGRISMPTADRPRLRQRRRRQQGVHAEVPVHRRPDHQGGVRRRAGRLRGRGAEVRGEAGARLSDRWGIVESTVKRR